MNHKLLTLGALAFLTTSVLLGRQGTTSQGVTLRGTVTRAGTSEPIPDVQISITSGRGGGFGGDIDALLGGGRGANPPQFSTQTDREGRFSVSGLTPNTYSVRAEREGYFATPGPLGNPQAWVQTPTTIVAGQTPPQLAFSLVPGAAISGTAVDSEGRPVVAAAVQVWRLNYQNGAPVLQSPGVAASNTDDRGAYRLFRIPPGDYYLAASPGGAGGRGGFSNPARSARGATPPREGLVPTYYPSALNAKDARLITLRGGEDLTGTAIAVRNSPLITVSGQIISNVPIPPRAGPRGNDIPQSVTLMLFPHDRNAIGTTYVTTVGTGTMDTPTNGQFQITGIPPGSYELVARVANPNITAPTVANAQSEPASYFGRTTLEAGFQDLQGVSLTINSGVDLKAYVTVDGSASSAAGNVRLQLVSDDGLRFLPQYATARGVLLAGPDGNIAIPFVNEGLYRLQVNLNPGAGVARGQRGGPSFLNAYVEDIRGDGLSVYDNGLQVGKQPPRQIEVIVKTNGGVVEGTVYDAQQQLKAGATVVLVPPDARRQNPALYKATTSDAMGHFTIRAVAPGLYKVFAWESVPTGAYQNAAFISKYETQGQSITVNASTTTSSSITAIPQDR